MVEQTDTAAPGPDRPNAEPHATLEELVAEPERVAGEAATTPVHIDGPDGTSLVLLNAETFAALRRRTSQALFAWELTDEQLDLMSAQSMPESAAAFDDEVPEGWLERPA